MLLPTDQVTVVSLGWTWPKAHQCKDDISGEDDTVSVRLLYDAMKPVLNELDKVRKWYNYEADHPGAPQPKGLVVHPARPPPDSDNTLVPVKEPRTAARANSIVR